MTTQPRDAVVTVGDYTLITKIGEGGMGVVHLARHRDGRRVALKVLRPQVVGDDDGRARLEREVSSLSRVRSKWVAEVLDADPWAPVPYIATRYVPGLSLHDHVVEEGPITGGDLLWFAGCLAEGIDAVHAVGVLHRDVKPSNVLMEGRTPILIDFGLAKVADDPRLTHTGWLIGTPGYLAPEILYGEDATEASDVHSWAATVAYAGTGRAPFGRGPSMAVMDRVRRGEHDLTGLTGDLARVVDAALSPDPDRRPTLPEVLDWLRPQTTRVRRVVPPPPVPVEPAETQPWGPTARPWERTEVAPHGHEDDLTEERPWLLDGAHTDDAYDTAHDIADDTDDRSGGTRLLTEHRPWDWDGEAPYAEAPEPVPFLERARRALLTTALGAATTALLVGYPLPTTAVLLVATWLLRSGSIAASMVGERRQQRGRKWYDGPRLLLGAPWDLLRSIPSTLVLQLWSLGLAAAAGLLCYAAALSVPTTLTVAGGVLTGSLWFGPGGSRVRSPLGRVIDPLSARAGSWLVATVTLAALAVGAAYLVSDRGVDWAPFDHRPLQGQQLPTSWLGR